MNRKRNITLYRESIFINNLDNPRSVSDFIRCINRCIEQEIKTVKIIIKCKSVFPNACLPIAGLLQFYQKEYGIHFAYSIPYGHYLSSCGFENPFCLTATEIKNEPHPFDKIICYSESEQIAELTQAYINAISRSSECASGVIDSLIWCLNEVMDNILVHSECECGYILVQYHPKEKHIAICIFDYGVGIFETLKSSTHVPKSAIDAISLAIQEGVGDGKGQGNGLYGLYGIIEDNKGQLTITSGNASLFYKSNQPLKKYEKLPMIHAAHHQGTIVDFQMDLKNDVNLTKVFKSIGGFDGFDIRLDDMLTENDYYLYDVYKYCNGTATREAGNKSFNDVLNIFTRRNAPMILDFSNVQNVSSSFIDEFIAKLVVKAGFYKFNQMFRLHGMKPTIEHLCNRAVAMRIYGEWGNIDVNGEIDETS